VTVSPEVIVIDVELDPNLIFDAVTPAIPMPLLVYVIVPLTAPFSGPDADRVVKSPQWSCGGSAVVMGRHDLRVMDGVIVRYARVIVCSRLIVGDPWWIVEVPK